MCKPPLQRLSRIYGRTHMNSHGFRILPLGIAGRLRMSRHLLRVGYSHYSPRSAPCQLTGFVRLRRRRVAAFSRGWDQPESDAKSDSCRNRSAVFERRGESGALHVRQSVRVKSVWDTGFRASVARRRRRMVPCSRLIFAGAHAQERLRGVPLPFNTHTMSPPLCRDSAPAGRRSGAPPLSHRSGPTL